MKSVKFSAETSKRPSQVLSIEAQAKRRKFRAKFQITKEKLTEVDIISILTAMNANLADKAISYEEVAKKIMSDLDKKQNGYVETNDLIEQLLIKEAESAVLNSEDDIYTKINQALHTKSEDIIVKLKHLQRKQFILGNSKFRENIDFIIKTITEENLYEVDSVEFSQKVQNKKHNGIDFLVKYSAIEDSNQKEKDFRTLRKQSKIYSSNSLKAVVADVKTSDERLNRRRSTNLSTMISPSIIARIYNQISKIDQCDFNIFELDELMGKKATIYVATEILSRFEMVEQELVEPDIFKNFIAEIVEHYDRVNAIYHNDLHAGDVMQTVFTIFTQGQIQDKMKLGQLDVFAMLVGALCHDFKHTGQNNIYHINTKSKIAMRYNDISVLENYHISQSFKVISKKPFNIFKNFSPEEYRICRRRMVEGILATDMANHQKVLSATKTKVELYDIVKGKNFEKIINDDEVANNLVKVFDSQQCILNMILHSADISNPGKPSKVSEQWTSRVYGEFFVQGDMERERGLPISNFCDRNTTNINKAMIGFITFVVAPTIDALVNLIPEVSDYSDYCKSNLRKHQLGAKNDERKVAEMKKKKGKEEEKK